MTILYNKTSEEKIRRELRQKETPVEQMLWSRLRNRLLCNVKFRRQYSVGKYVIDFYSPELKLAIEADGSIHDVEENKEKDEIRQNYLENFGIVFIRIKNEEYLYDPDAAISRIEKQILSMKKNLGVPPLLKEVKG